MKDEITTLVNLLTVGLSYSTIYFREHPRVRETGESCLGLLGTLLNSRKTEELFIGAARGRIVADGRVHVGSSLIADRLLHCLDRLHSGGLVLKRGLEAGELLDFFAFATGRQPGLVDLETVRRALTAEGVKNIELSPKFGERGWLGPKELDVGPVPAEAAPVGDLIRVYQGLFEVVQGAHESALQGRGIPVNSARTTVQHMLGTLQQNSDELLNLARYPSYDSYTVGHSVRVALFALIVAKDLQAEPHQLVEIGTAALLHDVGKSRIPSEILFKPSRLDETELRVMRMHPYHGAEILLENNDAGPLAVGAAFGHHLRADGHGYPDVPRWMPRSPVTNLVNVCDVFEALTAVRPYKPSLAPAHAFRIMLSDTGAYDPRFLSAFLRAVGLYPPGTRVRISSGEVCRVLRAGPRVDRPLLRVLEDKDGVALPVDDRPEIDLAEAENRCVAISEMELGDQSVVRVFESPIDDAGSLATH